MTKSATPPRTLSDLRQNIDRIDGEIVHLLSKRGVLAQDIGKLKLAQGAGAVYVPSREKEVLERVAHLNRGPFSEVSIHAIFREIISATRALEDPTHVAFLGPEATFTHMAAVQLFGTGAEFVPQTNIAAVFLEVEKGHADFGVVPVENSTEGVVNYTLDKFVESDLKICSEIIIGVEHHLLSRETDVSQVKRVYSHAQALAQCRQWISLHVPQAELKETESTASAAKRVVSEPGSAAVASAFAADIFGLGVLVANIQDQARNFTRFLVIGSSESERTGDDKTSIVFVAKDQVGVLYRLLKPLADARINLTKIESRPLKNKAWEYMFFVDMEGHIRDPKLKKALVKLQDKCEFFKVLGSYPKSVQNRKRVAKRKP